MSGLTPQQDRMLVPRGGLDKMSTSADKPS